MRVTRPRFWPLVLLAVVVGCAEADRSAGPDRTTIVGDGAATREPVGEGRSDAEPPDDEPGAEPPLSSVDLSDLDGPDGPDPVDGPTPPDVPPADDPPADDPPADDPPADDPPADDPPADDPPADDPPADDPPADDPPADDPPADDPPADPCPVGVVCVSSFPFSATGNTASASTDLFDAYACAPGTNESGPEVLYRLDVSEPGFLAAELTNLPAGVDVDVHVLSARDASSCVDRGHWRAGAWLEPGEYWVVVDSWVNASGVAQSGAYRLSLGLTTGASMAAEGMSADVAARGLRAFATAWERGQTEVFTYGMIDFSLHSRNRREWIVDLATSEVLFHLYVPHGDASSDPGDPGYARTFSNVSGSHQSSLGMVRTGEIYTGSYGYSHRLDGLETGYNDRVRSRAIVVHPWTGSRDAYVSSAGQTAPTWGCPAIDDTIATDVVDTMAGGSLMWFYYPDGDWSRNSVYAR